MDINQIPLGAIIEIEPAQTTAWSRPSKAENIGDLNYGEQYRVHKVHLESGLIELDKPAAGWPATLHPVSYGGVWIDARFVKLPGAVEPQPVGDDWAKRIVRGLGRVIREVLGD